MTTTMSKSTAKAPKSDTKAEKRRRQKLRREARKRDVALKELYPKAIEDWDDEELARGRPRASDGSFSGRPPKFVSRELHEEAIRRFTNIAQTNLRAVVPAAIAAIEGMILNDAVDDKGKPIVPPSVKLQAAQLVVEHLIGKPKQRLEADISVKLQGILASCLVVPESLSSGEAGDQSDGGFLPAIEAHSWEEEEELTSSDE